jgi:geranylgeranyl diphosphate synthase type I
MIGYSPPFAFQDYTVYKSHIPLSPAAAEMNRNPPNLKSMRDSCLKRLQERYGAAIDAAIQSRLSGSEGTDSFFGMMRYQLGYVDQHLEPAGYTSAKRFRPALALLACEAVGGNPENALPTAASIELLHNFSLIHDDIEDHDPSRRHRPSVWRVWGEPQAINAGDGMFALAGCVVLAGHYDPHRALALSRGLQDTALMLTEGQYMDMSFEHRQDVSEAEYMHMITLKTGTLTAFSSWSGALIGGAEEGSCEALRRYGREMGRAFQIWDDILGIWGSPSVTGKEAAKDLWNRKKTLPVLLARARADGKSADIMDRFFLRQSDDLEALLSVLDATSARALAEERLQRYLAMAFRALRISQISELGRAEFEALARELAGQ